MTMVLPSWAFGDCLLAAVATIFDRLTAIHMSVDPYAKPRVVGQLTRAIDLRHHEPSEDGLVEGSIGTAWLNLLSAHTARAARKGQLTS